VDLSGLGTEIVVDEDANLPMLYYSSTDKIFRLKLRSENRAPAVFLTAENFGISGVAILNGTIFFAEKMFPIRESIIRKTSTTKGSPIEDLVAITAGVVNHMDVGCV